MANVYVRSGAGGAATGADWANAYLTLAAALTAKAAGDIFWVSEDHAETNAGTVTLTAPGTAASPNFIYCVDHAGTVPPVAADLRTTAVIAGTAIGGIVIGGGVAFWYGITFKAGTGSTSTTLSVGNSTCAHSFDACQFWLNTTNVGALISVGGSTSVNNKLAFNNTTLRFGATAQSIRQNSSRYYWRNTASFLAGATFPTTLFTTGGSDNGIYVFEGVDFSALGSGKTLVGAITGPSTYIFKDCKFGASLTVSGTPAAQGAGEVIVSNSDSGGTNYRQEKYSYSGTLTIETTIVHTGGASDGTTPIAWKIVTTANSKWAFPFEAPPIVIWNDNSGSSKTVTIEGIWGGGAVPNNDDIWIDVEYLGASSSPLGSFATSTKASNLAANSALSAGTGTWGGSTTKFKMSATFTPQQKGPFYVYVRAAAASSTFYIDPLAIVT